MKCTLRRTYQVVLPDTMGKTLPKSILEELVQACCWPPFL
jgi:hypothetical protein